MWKAFWNANKDRDVLSLTGVATDLKDALLSKSRDRSMLKLEELVEHADGLSAEIESFL